MSGPFQIEGYAIVSANGMIADCDCVMPNTLKFEADQQFLETSLDRADLLVHGRKSHEQQPNSPARRRLIMTRCVPTLERDPDTANAWLWNPCGISLEGACAALGVANGVIHVIGGTSAYDMFLPRYAEFHLCRAGKVVIPGGTPVLSEVGLGRSPDEVLQNHGLKRASTIVLDRAHNLTHLCFKRVGR